MRLTTISVAVALIVQCSFVAGASHLKPRRTTSILINPDAQPDLPSASGARVASQATGLDHNDIQGDILVGMKKNKELFFFFSIQDATAFKAKLASDIHGLITSTAQLLDTALQPAVAAVNIAFSQTGLTALGINDDLRDPDFRKGQFSDALALGDPGSGNWVQGFAGTGVHGVFLIASDTQANVDAELANIQNILGSSITEIHRLQGAARPGSEEGHEHFGFMVGIGQPAVKGFDREVVPGRKEVDAGVILTGLEGDRNKDSRPAWAKGGSFLAFRQLKQRVPEFNKFIADNALTVPGLTQQENIDLLGARMVGRWKSGAPIDLAPLRDDPVLGADQQRNNDFTYVHNDPGFDISTNQTMCPFAAHTRKTRPRGDFQPENTINHIMRAGIPYGPEVTEAEASAQASSDSPELERGLAFVSYQSNINQGFAFIQKAWVNNPSFMFGRTPAPGVDPIIGSTNSGPPGDAPRTVNGLDPLNFQRPIVVNPDFVVSRGGEYFFSPPISALLTLSQ